MGGVFVRVIDMLDVSAKVLKLIKIALRAGTGSERGTAQKRAFELCEKHGLDYARLYEQGMQELRVFEPGLAADDGATVGADSTDYAKTERPDGAKYASDLTQEWRAKTDGFVWDEHVRYTPESGHARMRLACAVMSTLLRMGFVVVGECAITNEVVCERVVVQNAQMQVVVRVYTSIEGGFIRPKGTDQIRVCAFARRNRDGRTVGLVNSWSWNGKKGHTVKRCGLFAKWEDGKLHGGLNQPGILGRLYRELSIVRDQAKLAAQGVDFDTLRDSRGDAEVLRDYMFHPELRAKLTKAAHPEAKLAAKGVTLADYIRWVLTRRTIDKAKAAKARALADRVLGL